MARYKNDPANEGYNAGDEFNYAVWTADTELTLCNVPWDAQYKDVVHYESTAKLNEYIDERGDITRISNASYARVDEPISIDMAFSRAMRYNYVRVFNPAQPIAGDTPRYYYYFIRGVRHVAPQTTEIAVQLDVWQTFIRQIQFGRAYIEQGHIGVANEDNFRNYGRDFLAIPDGLDTGGSYVNVVSVRDKIMSRNPLESPGLAILAISTVDIHGDHGTVSAPKQPSAKPTFLDGIPTGAGAYVWRTASEFMAFMNSYSLKPWVTQGIVSITLLPGVPSTAFMGPQNPNTLSYDAKFLGTAVGTVRKDYAPNWRDSVNINNYIPARYRRFRKLWTSPYMMIEMTVNAGSAIVLKPEEWKSRDASIIKDAAHLPPSQRISFTPMNYNARAETPSTGLGSKDGDYLDMTLFLSAFPTIPIVNNGQISYLASNARSIAQQYKSLDWSQQRALQGNQTAYDQANTNIDAGIAQGQNAIGGDYAQRQIANELASQQALFNLLGGTAQGAGMGAFAGPAGAIAGGVGGAASGAMGMIGTGMQIDANNRSLAASVNTRGGSMQIEANRAWYMADSNKGLADWAAKGDYKNARAQMDAKIQDTALIPHGMSGQYGGEAFNLITGNADFIMRWKMIDQSAMAVIGEYWLRYGYPVRRPSLIPNDLRVMTKFSYWKLSECYIRTGAIPETFKQAIRGVMEKGVTVWTNANDIGVIDFADNNPLPDIVLEGYEPPPWEPEPDPDPEPTTRKRRKKMIIYTTIDGTQKWALAGTSPGTDANYIVTDSAALAQQWLTFYGAEDAVSLTVDDFYAYQVLYTGPVLTLEFVEGA
jgi:hypothetical protein